MTISVSHTKEIALKTNWYQGKLRGIYSRSVVYAISDGEYIGWHLKTYGGLWNDRESNPCRYLTTIQDFVEEKINICDTAGFIAMDKIALEILKMNGNFDEKLLIDKIGIDRRHVAEIELLRVRI